MKITINGVAQRSPQRYFNKGDIIETGHGSIIILTEAYDVVNDNHFNGFVLKSTRSPQTVGEYTERMFSSSGVIKLFEGSLTLVNAQ